MKCSVIIPAGGVGVRSGQSIPKQYVELMSIPIIIHTLRVFDSIQEIDNIIIAVNDDYIGYLNDLINKYDISKKIGLVMSGKERQDSVYNALNSITYAEDDIVLIHDAVRPLASRNLILNIIEATNKYGAAIPGLTPKETIKELSSDGFVSSTIDRSTLINVQTPQGFRLGMILEAYKNVYTHGIYCTDDASVAELSGYQVKVIVGEESNIKITTPLDFIIAENMMNRINR